MQNVAQPHSKRNEGGRYTTKTSNDWYQVHEAANIARVEAMEAQATLATLAEVVGDAVTAMPQAAPRIAKAAHLVQTKAVWELTSGSYLVGAESDTEKAYLVRRNPWTCECADHVKGGTQFCKHIVSVMLVIKLGTAYTPSYN